MAMLVFAVVCLASLAQAKTVPPEVDMLNNLSLDDFEDYFGFDHITDPVEKARREEALKQNEEMVKKANEAYLSGEQSWYEKINEFADLPKDEFESGHTGLVTDYARGLINVPTKPDERSEKFFSRYRYSRQQASVPDSYDARALGLVTPVKSQGSCGSCTAFANMAAVETCFAKKLGKYYISSDILNLVRLPRGDVLTPMQHGCIHNDGKFRKCQISIAASASAL